MCDQIACPTCGYFTKIEDPIEYQILTKKQIYNKRYYAKCQSMIREAKKLLINIDK